MLHHFQRPKESADVHLRLHGGALPKCSSGDAGNENPNND